MCACVGIEVLVALGYVCGLEAKGVEEVARWAALALFRASLGESSDGGCSGVVKMRPYSHGQRQRARIYKPSECPFEEPFYSYENADESQKVRSFK